MSPRDRGMVVGIAVAIAATVAAFGALSAPNSAVMVAVVSIVFLGPILTGVVLICKPRTRASGGGLLTGLAFIWVSVALVALATLMPFMLG